MADFLSIEVTGSQELQRALDDVVARLDDRRPLLERIGAVLESNIESRFDAKRDPNGQAWAPLAESTRAGYDRADTVRRGRNAGQVRRQGTLLERTRQMRDSLAREVGDDFVEVGMNRVSDDGKWQIPLLHETGTKRGLPRRGIFFADPDAGTLGAQDEADVMTEITDFLDDVFGQV